MTQTANPIYSEHTEFSNLDIAVSILLHLLVLALIVVFGLWHRQTQSFHPIGVKVHLISAHQLRRLQHHSHSKRRHHRPKTKQKPVMKHKPALKHKLKPAIKHHTKPKPKARDNFDPFKPMQSSTDAKTSTHASPEASQIFQGQLSKQEINRYIALIQRSVQQHWKVPNIGNHVRDPLVEMVLNPGGSVREVNILESSGNAALDASLIRAIESASPFQVPRRQFELFRHNKIRFHPLR